MQKRRLDRIIDCITFTTGDYDASWHSKTRLKDDIQLEDMDLEELVIELEDEFDIDVDDDAAKEWQTIGDIERYLEEKEVA